MGGHPGGTTNGDDDALKPAKLQAKFSFICSVLEPSRILVNGRELKDLENAGRTLRPSELKAHERNSYKVAHAATTTVEARPVRRSRDLPPSLLNGIPCARDAL